MPVINELDKQPTETVNQKFTEALINGTPDDTLDGLLITGILIVALPAMLYMAAKAVQLQRLNRLRKRSPNTPRRKRKIKLLIAGIIITFMATEISVSHLLLN